MRHFKIYSTIGLILVTLLISNISNSQTYWKTTTSPATWTTTAHWQKSTDYGSTWLASGGTYPNSTNDYVSELNGTLTCNASVTVCALYIALSKTLTINSGSTLSVSAGASGTQSNIYGTLTNNGTLNNTATINIISGGTLTNSNSFSNNSGTLNVSGTFDNRVNLTANGTITVANGGTYKHNYSSSAGTIPTCTWAVGSTCEWAGTSNSNLSLGLSQSFYHFKVNRSISGECIWELPATFTILGNLIFTSTGSSLVYLGFNNGVTMNISGNLQFDGGTVNGNAAGSYPLTINIGGNYTQSSGMFLAQTATSSTTIITVNGNTTISGTGRLSLTISNQKSPTPNPVKVLNQNLYENASCRLVLKGDLSVITGGILSTDEIADVWFSKTGTQTYTSGGSVSGNFNFYVKSGAVLGFADKTTTLYVPLATFTLESGAGMIISHRYGISSIGAIGCIGINSTSFSTGANYEYCTDDNHETGTGLPLTVNNFAKSGTGSVTLTSASLTVSGTAAWTAGTFAIPSKTLTMNGSIINTAGTLSCNTSTVINVGGSGSTSVLPAVTGSPASLTVNRAAGVTMGGTLSVTNLTLTSGNLSMGAYTLSLNGTLSNPGGNLVSSSTSGLTIGGPGGSAFTIPSNITSLSDLTINRTNGALLSSGLTVSGTLTLSAGTLTLGAYNLTLGATSTVSGTPSSSNMIITNSTGVLRKMFSSAGSFTFPVGTTGAYTPATVNFTSGTFGSGAYLDVLVVASKHASNTSGTDYLKRYWTFNQNSITNFTYNINLQYISPTDVNGTESNIYSGKWDGSVWQLYAQANTTTHQLSGTGATGFSTFTGGSQGAMPVSLSSFTSNVSGQNVNLKWITSSETNNTGFNIERKTTETEWSKVGFVSGKGTTNTQTSYEYTDSKLNTGKYQYRLKQIDNNGNFEYHTLSGEAEISLPTKFALSQNYPNPFNSTTIINFSIPNLSFQHDLSWNPDNKIPDQTLSSPNQNLSFQHPSNVLGQGSSWNPYYNVTLKLYDINGKEILTLINNQPLTPGYHTITLNASSLSTGTYFYKLTSTTFTQTKKMLLLK